MYGGSHLFEFNEIEKEISDILLPVTDNFIEVEKSPSKEGEYMFYLNDTKNNSYADNNYYFVLSLNGMNVDNGYYRSIDCLNKTNMYSELKNSIERISQLDYVKVVNCGVDFDESYKNLNLEIIVNESNYPVQDKSKDLISKGIMVGHYYMGIKLKNYILKCRKFIGSSNDHDITRS